jgi:TolB-like protein/Flp pilus assembly protein TadD/predicted Ser/Thr protein kinase
MKPERWQHVKEILNAALERDPDERAAFVAARCGDDEAMRKEVQALLLADEQAGSFAETPAIEVMAGILATNQSNLLVGQALDHYRVIERLGGGGMGEVYLAQDTRLGRHVALKLLPSYLSKDEDRLHRFEQEARAASALNHPNVCVIHEVGETEDDRHYIAMEYIDGVTLRQHMAKKRVKLSEALDVAAQIAAALAAAHNAGIAHRDIKHENVMVRNDGLVKVLDFGLAKRTALPIGAESEASTRVPVHTDPGMVMGTVSYMSPEQVRGLEVDALTDIWSLGVVLYEMVTGRAPFAGATTSDVIVSILEREPPPLVSYAPEAPTGLERIVRRCLEKDQERRYQSARDLLNDLKNLQREIDSGVAATVAERGETWRNPSRRFLVAASAVVALIVAALVYALLFRGAPTAAPLEIKSLAVLPLKSIGGQAGDDYLGLGIADTIITKVSQVGELRVRPTSAVRRYVGQEIDALEAARQLKVDSVLDGTVQRAGDRLRVNVNLLRVSDGAPLWSDSFNVSFADIFAMQDELSRQVASQLRFNLSASEVARLAKQYTWSPEAYQYYLKGTYSFEKAKTAVFSRTDFETTIAIFKKAIEIDSKYALAHAQLAHCYAWMALFVELENPAWIGRARQELSQAETLDPQLAEVHVVRYDILWSAYEGFNIEGAIRELQLAQQLSPNSSQAHGELGSLYYHLGLEEPALRELQRALELDPTSELYQDRLVQAYELLGRYDEAIAANQRFFNRVGPPLALLWKDRLKEAAQSIAEALARNPNHPFARSAHARLLALNGAFQEAEAEELAILEKAGKNRAYHHLTYDLAAVYALAGKNQEAIAWLKKTVDLGMPNYLLFARDPHLDRIRKEPAFVQFMTEQKTRWDNYQREFK